LLPELLAVHSQTPQERVQEAVRLVAEAVTKTDISESDAEIIIRALAAVLVEHYIGATFRSVPSDYRPWHRPHSQLAGFSHRGLVHA
jgi:hypothetical protein